MASENIFPVSQQNTEESEIRHPFNHQVQHLAALLQVNSNLIGCDAVNYKDGCIE